MAGALKQEFIEAVRLTPEGIAAFLGTPIPDPPTYTPPTDTDSAILVSGILSGYLLDFFAPFAGLTPVELLLRIGQHNTVLESAMLAGLEYIEGADSAESVIEIREPNNGASYAPGEMRFSAISKNALCVGMTLTLNDGDPIKMIATEDAWQQHVFVNPLEYTATVNANFEDGSTASASVSFTVTAEPPGQEPPQPPGGTDADAITRAYQHFLTALQTFLDAIYADQQIEYLISSLQAVQAAFFALKEIAVAEGSAEILQSAEDALNEAFTLLSTSGRNAMDDIVTALGTCANIIKKWMSSL